jgi:hypothetical protein
MNYLVILKHLPPLRNYCTMDRETVSIYYRIKRGFFLIMALISFQLNAQNALDINESPLFETIIIDTVDAPPRYHINYFGLGFIQQRDRFLSPLRYSGIAFNNDYNSITYRRNRISLFRNVITTGFSGNDANNSSLTTLDGEVGYSEMFKITAWRNKCTRFYAGPGLKLHLLLNFHTGNQNNVLSYAGAIPLVANGLFEHRFRFLNRNFQFSNHLSIPIIAALTRNPFAYPVPDLSEGGYNWHEVIQYGFWNRYLNLQNRMTIDFYMNRKRRGKIIAKVPFRLGYFWNMIHMGKPNEMQMGGHFFSVSTMLRQKL